MSDFHWIVLGIAVVAMFVLEYVNRIRNVLVVLEPGSFGYAGIRNDFVHIMPPDVSHKSNLTFQSAFVQGFFSPQFLLPYLRYRLTHRFDYGMNTIINPTVPTRTRYTNDALLPQEGRIARMGEAYWHQDFWDVPAKQASKPTINPPILAEEEQTQLRLIKDICQRHHTRLKIIICPMLKRQQMNPKDVSCMKHLLGPNVVYDFSSSQYFWMDDYQNFYDPAHFRRCLAQRMLNIAYP